MTALADNRLDSKKMIGSQNIAPVAANAVIHVGAMVAINASGYLIQASTSTTLTVVGVAAEAVDNTGGANGDLTCRFDRGNFVMKNSTAGDALSLTDVGAVVFAVDDQTVAKTDGGATRSAAGVLHWFDADGPWVHIDT